MSKFSKKDIEEILSVCKSRVPAWAFASIASVFKGDEDQDKCLDILKDEGLDRISKYTKRAYKSGELARFMEMLPEKSEARALIRKELERRGAVKKKSKEKGFQIGTPDNGIHLHGVASLERTHVDGAHYHVFELPDGTMVFTEEDGGHSHVIEDGFFQSEGDHAHRIIIDGQEYRTELDGGHSHDMLWETSALDGTHSHRLVLPTGETVESVKYRQGGTSAAMPPASLFVEAMASLIEDVAIVDDIEDDEVSREGLEGIEIVQSEKDFESCQRGEVVWSANEDGFFRRGKKAMITRAQFNGIVGNLGHDGETNEILAIDPDRGGRRVVTFAENKIGADIGDCVLVEVDRQGAAIVGQSYLPDIVSDAGFALNVKKAHRVDLLGFVGPEKSDVIFVCPQPNSLEMARGEPLVGADAEVFKAHYLDPIGLSKSDVRIGFACPVPDVDEFNHYDRDWSGWIKKQIQKSENAIVIALGRHARMALGPLADFSLPHPASIRRKGDSGEVSRKMKQITKRLDSRSGDLNNHGASDTLGAQRPADKQSGDKAIRVRVAKKAEGKERILLGVVLDPYRVDAHGTLVLPDVVESTAYGYMEKHQVIKVQHGQKEADAEARIVESFIEPYPSPEDRAAAMEGRPHKVTRRRYGDDLITSGTWVMGVRFGEEIYKAYERGEFTGFSIGALTYEVEADPSAVQSFFDSVEIVNLVPESEGRADAKEN